MFNISDYLKKFSKIEGETLLQRDTISRVLKDECGVPEARFSIRKGILYIAGSPALKSAVYTRKAKVIESINKSLPLQKILDIR